MNNNPLPHIGKNVIETLTLGMYENPLFIFREYVQNSADQIDIAVEKGVLLKRTDGKIQISLNLLKKEIVIEDNATGIPKNKAINFLSDVANSEKELNKRKGFRGIGRLGGLGYCDKLKFETSSKGENVKTIFVLDAKILRSIINNVKDKSDAASVISAITNVFYSDEKEENHYFRVTLQNVPDGDLLNESKVKDYLSIVAPIPFSEYFSHKDTISNYYLNRGIVLDEYNVLINQKQIYKAYKDDLIFTKGDYGIVNGISFFEVKDEKSSLLAIGWYGINTKLNYQIDKVNIERGIRIRKHNITIGNETTLFKRFGDSPRTNLRYIGEIHILGNGFIPNARRDYFNLNYTVEQFEKSLDNIFRDFESKLPHVASNLHTRYKTIKNCKQAIIKYNKEKKEFKTTEEKEQRLGEVIRLIDSANLASIKIDKIKEEGEDNITIKSLFDSIIGSYNYHISIQEIDPIYEEIVYPPLEFSKVNAEVQIILNEVVVFLQKELGYSAASPLLKKLQNKYN